MDGPLAVMGGWHGSTLTVQPWERTITMADRLAARGDDGRFKHKGATMAKPDQGSLSLLDDPAAQRLLASQQVAHLAYNWTDGTPRCTSIWFHWNGDEVVMAGPAIAPKGTAVQSGDAVAVTIDDPTWPYSALLIRGSVQVDEVDGVASEYREAAVRYFGEEQGNGWCDQLPPMKMHRFRVTPEWVGVLDFDDMRRLTSSLATLMTAD